MVPHMGMVKNTSVRARRFIADALPRVLVYEKRQKPFIRTSKIDKFRQEFVDFFLSIQIAYPTQKVGGNLLTKKKYAL